MQNELADAGFGSHLHMASTFFFPSGSLLQWNDWRLAQLLRPPSLQRRRGERGGEAEVTLSSEKWVSGEAKVWPEEKQTFQLFNSWRTAPFESRYKTKYLNPYY